jgi:opacity protein-like surface antigen
MPITRKTWILVAAACAAFALAAPVPAHAQSHGGGGYYAGDHAIRFRLGLFEPRGDLDYWNDSFDVFTGDTAEFEDVDFGVDFKLGLGSRTSILFSGNIYAGEADQAYRDFVDEFGDRIVHTTTLDVASATAAFVVDLAPRRSVVVPYVGVGGGIYAWSLEESGDFIDFVPLDPVIFNDTFDDDGAALGWFWLVGLDVPVGPQWSFFAEARWQQVEDELGGDFEDLGDLDLSGRSISGGVAWRF